MTLARKDAERSVHMPAKASRITFSFMVGLGATTAAWAQQPFADANCPEYDSFVQEYEYTDRFPMAEGFTPCAGSDLTGPQPFPEQRITVRIEYQRGDYFVAQEKRDWSFEPTDAGCADIQPRLVREFSLREGRDEERAIVDPGGTRRTRDGDSVGNSLIAGTAKARQPPPRQLEETPFGVACGRIDASVTPAVPPGGSLCKVYLPKRCKSELYMAPIEFSGVLAGAPMRGRTTSLVIGRDAGVDRSQWVMP